MTADEFIKRLVELIDTDAAINLSTKLADLQDWDSLSMVAFFSYCNATLKRHITPDELKAASTVEDLFKLANPQA